LNFAENAFEPGGNQGFEITPDFIHAIKRIGVRQTPADACKAVEYF
jgi:hypothetical protein